MSEPLASNADSDLSPAQIAQVLRLKALADQCFGPVVVVSRGQRHSFVDRISAFHEGQKLLAKDRVLAYVLLEYLNRIQSEFRQNFEIKLTQEIKTCLHKFLGHQSWKS